MRALLLGLLLVAIIAITVFNEADAAPLASGCQPQPMMLWIGGENQGNLCPSGTEDLYYFDGERGDQIEIRMRGNLNPRLELWTCCSRHGYGFRDDVGNQEAKITLALPYSGRYAIRAGSDRGNTGSYHISLRRG